MDKIDQIYLQRIKYPQTNYFCYCNKYNKKVDLQTCFYCTEMDMGGHCDYQEDLEVVKL